jgi:glucosamine--fructose-6-phosphate aminotransferase (isomerizing)
MARQLGYDTVVAHHPVGLPHRSWTVFRRRAEFLREVLAHIKGASAFVFLSKHGPDRLVMARLGNAGGLTVGVGHGEMFVASDIPAILEHTRDMIFLEGRQMAVITREGARVNTLTGEPVDVEVHMISWDRVSAAKGAYRHFMQKEIYEQARSITDTIRGRALFDRGRVRLENLELSRQEAETLEKIVIVACGTSAYAGLVGKFVIEALARLPVEVDYRSESRYRDPIIDENTAVLAITQSGETVDTLAAMEEGREKGARLWSIVNVIGSQADRMSGGHILMHAGPEIGVASTKAFTSSLVDLYMLGLYVGER